MADLIAPKLAQIPAYLRWQVTVLDSKEGKLGVKLFDRKSWTELGSAIIYDRYTKAKTQRITEELAAPYINKENNNA